MKPPYIKIPLFLLLTGLTLLASHAAIAAKKELHLTPLQNFNFIETKKNGFLLIELATTSAASSLEISRLDKKAGNYTYTIGRRLRTDYSVNLKNLDNGFYVADIPTGLYQIKEVTAPLYNLPYRIQTDGRRIWRVSIEEAHINYAGRLKIEQERSVNAIDVGLINRFSQSLPELIQHFEKASVQTPLRIGLGYRDDFYQELQQ